MAPSSRTTALKQGTLAFGSTKRTSAAALLAKKPSAVLLKPSPTPAPTKATPKPRPSRKRQLSDDISDSDSGAESPGARLGRDVSSDVDLSTLATSSPEPEGDKEDDAEGNADNQAQILEASASAHKRRRIALPKPTNATPPSPTTKRIKVDGRVVQASPIKTEEEEDVKPRETLNTKDKRYNKLISAAREKTGTSQPIHSGTQSPVHHLLRVFDLSYEYGPCVGVTRLQRWERANAMGLNPPTEIRDILHTEEGFTKPEFAQSVFYAEV